MKCDAGEAKCFGPCPELEEWKLRIDPKGELYGDLDDLQALAIADEKVRAACEAKLRACQSCLRRLSDEKVIRLEGAE